MGQHGTEEEAAAFAWAPGRWGEDGRARRHFEEHADRVGVPLEFRAGVADVMLERGAFSFGDVSHDANAKNDGQRSFAQRIK